MRDFVVLKTECLGTLTRISPMRAGPMPGHLWTARLEIAGIIERIDGWIQDCPDIVERAKAAEMLEYFKSLPEGKYTVQQCVDALKEETAIWTGKKKRS